MAQNEKNNTLNPVAAGVAWTYEKNGKIFYSAIVDFGFLGGKTQFFIFKRDKSNDNPEKNNPDYTIRKSYSEEGESYLYPIGSLWIKEKEKDGEKIKYLSGILSAGVHGEYVIQVTNINYKETKKDDAPEKRIRIFISREINNNKVSNKNDDDVPF